MAITCCELKWLHYLHHYPLYYNNQVAFYISSNLAFHERIKLKLTVILSVMKADTISFYGRNKHYSFLIYHTLWNKYWCSKVLLIFILRIFLAFLLIGELFLWISFLKGFFFFCVCSWKLDKTSEGCCKSGKIDGFIMEGRLKKIFEDKRMGVVLTLI